MLTVCVVFRNYRIVIRLSAPPLVSPSAMGPSATVPSLWQAFRRLLPSMCVCGVLLLQFSCATVPTIDSCDFDTVAVEIERTDGWRYGYVDEGRVRLVKAKVRADDLPFEPPERDDPIAKAMARDLRRRWPKAGVELVL